MNSLPPNFPTTKLPETDLYKIQWFYRKYVEVHYEEYGFGHYLLAAYTAVPLFLTPDLVYKIWQNFNAFKWAGDAVSIHRVAVPDVLLSPLCREVGFELYEMHPNIRMALLQWLHTEAGMPIWQKRELKTIKEIAAFVAYYYEVPNTTGHRWGAGYVETQALEAKSFLNPAEVADTLFKKLQLAANAQQESEMLRLMDQFVKTKKRVEMLDGQDTKAFNLLNKQADFMEAWKTLIQKNNTSFIERLNANPDLLQLLSQTYNGGIEIKISGGVVEKLALVTERKVFALIIGAGNNEGPNNLLLQSQNGGNAIENSAGLMAEVLEEFIAKEQLTIELLTGDNATKAGILQVWNKLCTTATANDDLLIYIAANSKVANGNCLIVCADSENSETGNKNLLADEEIGKIATISKGRSVTAIIQADYAGTHNWLDTTQINHVIFASCKHKKDAGNYVLKDKQRSYFAFTYALVQALRRSRMKLPLRELFANMLYHFEQLVQETNPSETR